MRAKVHPVELLKRIGTDAIVGGYGQHVPWRDGSDAVHRVVRLGLEMDCDEPYHFEMSSCWDATGAQVAPYTIIGAVRCRKCDSCKARRSRMWTMKALDEFHRAARTIFVTFTISPESHFDMDQVLRSRYTRKGVNFDVDLQGSEKFTARARGFGEHLTKYLKRLRRGDSEHPNPGLRYLMIAEAHDSEATSPEMRGRPHFHALLHEMEAGALVLGDPAHAFDSGEDGEWEVRKEKIYGQWKPCLYVKDDGFIRKNWKLGFSKAKLCDSPYSAGYICKYLAKSLEVRVRASQGYGLITGIGLGPQIPVDPSDQTIKVA